MKLCMGIIFILMAGCAELIEPEIIIHQTQEKNKVEEAPVQEVDVEWCEAGAWGWYAVIMMKDHVYVYITQHKISKDEIKVFIEDIICRIHEEAVIYIMPQSQLSVGEK